MALDPAAVLASTPVSTDAPRAPRPHLRGFEFYRALGSPKFVVAPMVDQSELVFRMQCRRHGADLCYTPMLHSKSYRDSTIYRTEKFSTVPEDRPLFVQVCGDDIDALLFTARDVQDRCDAIDLNFGCPQNIAKRGHYGAFLLEEHERPLLLRIVRTLAESLDVPVTCKIRCLPKLEDTLRLARELEEAGASLLTVHGRTRQNKGENIVSADWSYIAAVKKAVRIPVFANGSIGSRLDALRCMEVTGVDGVMSSEAILEDPALFSRPLPEPGALDVMPLVPPTAIDLAREHLELCETYGTTYPIGRMHLFKFLHAALVLHTDLRDRLHFMSGDVMEVAKEVISRMDPPVTTVFRRRSVLQELMMHLPHTTPSPPMRCFYDLARELVDDIDARLREQGPILCPRRPEYSPWIGADLTPNGIPGPGKGGRKDVQGMDDDFGGGGGGGEGGAGGGGAAPISKRQLKYQAKLKARLEKKFGTVGGASGQGDALAGEAGGEVALEGDDDEEGNRVNDNEEEVDDEEIQEGDKDKAKDKAKEKEGDEGVLECEGCAPTTKAGEQSAEDRLHSSSAGAHTVAEPVEARPPPSDLDSWDPARRAGFEAQSGVVPTNLQYPYVGIWYFRHRVTIPAPPPASRAERKLAALRVEAQKAQTRRAVLRFLSSSATPPPSKASSAKAAAASGSVPSVTPADAALTVASAEDVDVGAGAEGKEGKEEKESAAEAVEVVEAGEGQEVVEAKEDGEGGKRRLSDGGGAGADGADTSPTALSDGKRARVGDA